MSIIVSGLRKAVSWVSSPVLDKEHFLKKLQKISNNQVYTLNWKNDQLYELARKYEGRGEEVSKWLIEVADDEKESTEFRRLAVSSMNFHIRRPGIVECLLRCIKNENSWIREQAVKKLSILEDEKLLPTFASCLDDNDHFVAQAAADAIVKIDGPESYKILKDKIEAGSTNKSILSRALDNLEEEIGNSLGYKLQHGLFSNNEDEMKLKRKEIIDGFINLYGEDKALDLLVDIVLNFDLERRELEEAIKCLEEIGSEKTFKHVIKGLYDRA